MAVDRDIQDIIIAIFLLFALFADNYLHSLKTDKNQNWQIADFHLLKNFFKRK